MAQLTELRHNSQIMPKQIPQDEKITGESHVVIPGFEIKARGEVYIPISPEGKTIKEAVRLPIQDRQPVGYNRVIGDARGKLTFKIILFSS
jgi:hypothetical protein